MFPPERPPLAQWFQPERALPSDRNSGWNRNYAHLVVPIVPLGVMTIIKLGFIFPSCRASARC